ncbi:hypothetical protein UAW_01832 [Enterococcus haemoperoxidus ATCC BAA-382]|uniref:Uncharacterized protein n=2 Tax=Enterococcus haemoperoxidus TaxID=155618 RepID=R2QCM0_9ENTE|nr:DUF916 and DUF3324 domain-containing protein [Enterococcus haemoperoxidus]EOH92968.1 hypothetical protein UAW_02718 [Enterococcus haemoperoxidus ATCC BAA-382]EOH96667.1 hypothetical protein UAW_01832 [Enterococcus haemoperoxidus ATCC BAA-382]EOT60163.1 hypothetical protein I583_02798 [Enterococcus haemoperoxidus ATCC BAA-382]EOT61422.1 hypothetical protein I583_00401 [Enterococcus haemoperoxidus ATCC BAA-382]
MTYLNKRITFLIFILAIFGFLSPQTAQAENKPNAAGAAGFSYSIHFPENQMEKDIGYYHLKMTPNQKQTLSITLNNPSEENVEVAVSLNSAKTNPNGVIEYGDSSLKNDPSLAYDFKKIVSGPDKVALAAGETKEVELTIQMPETAYEGVLSGGIQLMKTGQDQADETDKGSKIINQYAYVIGVLLQESDKPVTPELALNTVMAGQSNYRNTVYVHFSNITATYVNDLTAEVQITSEKSKEVLYERKQTAMRMAPNSFINFPVSMNGEKMVPGKYKAAILVTSGDQKWTWDKDFTITDKEANQFNERDVGLVQKKGLDWTMIGWIVGSIVFFTALLFGVMVFFRKKKEAETKKRKKSRK